MSKEQECLHLLGEQIISRINLGKQKYGGPFNETDVEDVKTFWRIVEILLSTFGFYIPYYIVVDGVFPYLNAMKGATTSLNGYGSVVLWKALDEQIIILVPLVELIILPLFPKFEYFILNPLRGLKIVYCLLLTGLIGILILDTVGHYLAQDFVHCYFTTSSSYGVLPISFLYYAIPLTLTGLADVLSYIFLLEFICCQSPLNMSGMLSGVLWFIRGFYLNILLELFLPFLFHSGLLMVQTGSLVVFGYWFLRSCYVLLDLLYFGMYPDIIRDAYEEKHTFIKKQ